MYHSYKKYYNSWKLDNLKKDIIQVLFGGQTIKLTFDNWYNNLYLIHLW